MNDKIINRTERMFIDNSIRLNNLKEEEENTTFELKRLSEKVKNLKSRIKESDKEIRNLTIKVKGLLNELISNN